MTDTTGGRMEARLVALERAFYIHESVCTERWQASRQSLDALREAVERNEGAATAGHKLLHSKIDTLLSTVGGRLWAIVGSIGALLLGIIGYLIHLIIQQGMLP